MLYAKQFYYVLLENDAQDLLTLEAEKRMNVMKSLAALSKYLGCYDRWQDIRLRYQLKWTSGDSLEIFNSMVNDKENYPAMLDWLRNACSALPRPQANILLYCTMVGLRADEAINSIRLIRQEPEKYLEREKMMLEHFKFPDIFIRRTKKAYISVVTDSIIDIAKEADSSTYNAVRLAVKRKELDMNMGYCRKIFGTYLRIQGLESETIDLLQGRLPKTVFAKHYFRPDFEDSCTKIRRVLKRLQNNIIG